MAQFNFKKTILWVVIILGAAATVFFLSKFFIKPRPCKKIEITIDDIMEQKLITGAKKHVKSALDQTLFLQKYLTLEELNNYEKEIAPFLKVQDLSGMRTIKPSKEMEKEGIELAKKFERGEIDEQTALKEYLKIIRKYQPEETKERLEKLEKITEKYLKIARKAQEREAASQEITPDGLKTIEKNKARKHKKPYLEITPDELKQIAKRKAR